MPTLIAGTPKATELDGTDVDALLAQVHARLGGLGVDLATYGDGTVIARWKREYPGEGWSEEREREAPSLNEALRGILAYEDDEDARVEAEGRD